MLAAVILGVSAGLAQDYVPTTPGVFLNVARQSYGKLAPTPNDLQFTFNSDGSYSVTVENAEIIKGGTNNYYRFYQVDEDGTLTQWGLLVSTSVLFNIIDLTNSYEITNTTSSPVQITQFANDLTSADVKFTLRLGMEEGIGMLTMEQIADGNLYPEKIYLWGSDEGGRNTKVFATLEPTEENPALFKATFDVPVCVFDPADVRDALLAFTFFLSTSGTSISSGTRFLAHLPFEEVEGEDPYKDVYIYLKKGETFSTILQTAPQESSSMLFFTPGLVNLTFDITTLEFTATMIDALNYASLSVEGNPNEAFEKYFELSVGGEAYKVEVNPQTIWYGGDLNFVLTPKEEWALEVECTTEDAVCTISENEGVYSISSTQKGLAFLVTLTYTGEEIGGGDNAVDYIGIEAAGNVVYNLQGVAVMRNASAEEVGNLTPGLYIVNGKKVIVK